MYIVRHKTRINTESTIKALKFIHIYLYFLNDVDDKDILLLFPYYT